MENGQKRAKKRRTAQIGLAMTHSGHYLPNQKPPRRGFQPVAYPAAGPLLKGTTIMRKIVLASAIAVSALGLAACSEETTDAAEETVEGAAADTEANLEAAGEGIEDAAADTGEAVEGATAEAEEEAAEAGAEVEEEAAE
ncbi:hypothetical protein [Alteriqipengyuania sp.]|uniref:hypothetical protein n=2 Tax=Alteriqipengyuania sp. TaxID=2800692 RepID=UPI003517DF84